MLSRKNKIRIGGAATIIIALIFIVIIGLGLFMHTSATNTPPSPHIPEQVFEDGFPHVDWDYWLSINPDIVGWITIPETTINKPIVQARPEDPGYYLTHDIYGNNNFYGALYLDAGCINHGLKSENAVIFGHNMDFFEDVMFGEIALYSDAYFAQDHSRILIQAPEWKDVKEVGFVTVVPGSDRTKRTSFVNNPDYNQWLLDRYNEALVKLTNDKPTPSQNYSLIACSYNFWANSYLGERTIVYAY